MSRYKIVSNGFATGTYIYDTVTGEVIQDVSNISWQVDANSGLATSTVVIDNVSISAEVNQIKRAIFCTPTREEKCKELTGVFMGYSCKNCQALNAAEIAEKYKNLKKEKSS